MRSLNHPVRFLIIALGGILFWSCSDDQESLNAPNPTPCVATAAQYTFKITNNINNNFFECDTIFPSRVRLTAGSIYTNVRWLIGSDPRIRTGNDFDIDFPEVLLANSVPITLIGNRPLNKTCFPKDDGIDTLTKVLTVVPLNEAAPRASIEGKFQGATAAAPADTFTVRIYSGPNPASPSRTTLNLVNLNKGCPGTSIDISAGYQGLVFSQGISNAVCRGVNGIGYLDATNRNKIHLEYQEQTAPGNAVQVKQVFIGTRIR